jgi:hypothetical protein
MNKIKELKELVGKLTYAKNHGGVVKMTVENEVSQFSYEELEDQFRMELRELAKDFNAYRRNKLVIFELMQDAVDAVLPKKVKEVIGMFAEVKTYPNGTKPVFTTRAGKNRAKQFITKVGLSGVYETFRLDNKNFEISTTAFGGAAQIELEQFLDGNANFDELVEIIMDGLEESIYDEINLALIAAITDMPAANKHSAAAFDATEMQSLVNTVMAYGSGATIFCTREFAGSIVTATGYVSDVDKNDIRNQGYLGKFYGADIVVLPQSFTDETNTAQVINPEYAWVIPKGGSASEKVVKVAIEGETIIDESKNADMSREIQAYKKFGTAVLFVNHIGSYQNTAL